MSDVAVLYHRGTGAINTIKKNYQLPKRYTQLW